MSFQDIACNDLFFKNHLRQINYCCDKLYIHTALSETQYVRFVRYISSDIAVACGVKQNSGKKSKPKK